MILGVLCLALTVVVGMMASLMVAVPDIAADTGASETELQWVVNAYGVTFAGLLLAAGALGDRFGRTLMLSAGLGIFGVASIGVLLADDIATIIALRAIAGVGAAAVMPMTLSIITHVFPEEERGRAVGIWSGVTVAGALVGLLVAGGLLQAYSWRSIFFLNAALALVALIATSLIPRQAPDREVRVDPIGAAGSVATVAAAVFALVEGPERGWTSESVLLSGAGAVVVGAAFMAWESRHRNPILDPALFRHRGLRAGAVVITAESVAMFGFFYVALQYLQLILGYSAWSAALAMGPLAVAAMVFSPVAPALATRVGRRTVMIGGMALIAAGLSLASSLDAGSDYTLVLASTALLGAGIAFAATPATEYIMGALPPERHGVASALNDVTRELGAVLGIALMGSLFNATYRDRITPALQGVPEPAGSAGRDSVTAAIATASSDAAPDNLLGAVHTSFAAGMHDALLLGAAVVLLGAIVAAVSRPPLAKALPTSAVPQQAGG